MILIDSIARCLCDRLTYRLYHLVSCSIVRVPVELTELMVELQLTASQTAISCRHVPTYLVTSGLLLRDALTQYYNSIGSRHIFVGPIICN